MEAKYITLSQAMQDIIPTRTHIAEVFTHSTTFKDHSGALTLANVPKMTLWSKHIGVKYHFFQDHVKQETVKIVHVSSGLQKVRMHVHMRFIYEGSHHAKISNYV